MTSPLSTSSVRLLRTIESLTRFSSSDKSVQKENSRPTTLGKTLLTYSESYVLVRQEGSRVPESAGSGRVLFPVIKGNVRGGWLDVKLPQHADDLAAV